MEAYNVCFPVWNYISISNSIFRNNTVGIVNLNPTTYYSSSALSKNIVGDLSSGTVFAYINNSLFIENNFIPGEAIVLDWSWGVVFTELAMGK